MNICASLISCKIFILVMFVENCLFVEFRCHFDIIVFFCNFFLKKKMLIVIDFSKSTNKLEPPRRYICFVSTLMSSLTSNTVWRSKDEQSLQNRNLVTFHYEMNNNMKMGDYMMFHLVCWNLHVKWLLH